MTGSVPTLTFKGRSLCLDEPRLMAVLNVTPDSFSDGGQFESLEAAFAQAMRFADEGADSLDIGAESTRPGHVPLGAEDEIARLQPILGALHDGYALPISVDTYKAQTADFALKKGASIINDIWGFSRDPEMASVVAAHDAAAILMHNRDVHDAHIDIRDDMFAFFSRALKTAEKAGIAAGRLALDPGIGFGKTLTQNLIALKSGAALHREFGLPVLVGASRKSFIDRISPSATDSRLGGTLAAHLLAVREGAHILRVHDVAAHVQALAVERAIIRAG